MPHVSELSILPVSKVAPALTDYVVCELQPASATGPFSALVPISLLPSGSGGLVINTSPITGGTNQHLLYNNAGVLGDLPLGVGLAISGGVLVNTGELTIGSSPISGGTSGRFLYDNAGVVGEAIIGSGLSFSGGTLTATGTLSGSGTANQIAFWNGTTSLTGDTGLTYAGAGGAVTLNGNAILTAPAAATLQHGAADAAAPVAQTIQVQSVVAGTSNTAGANWAFLGSKSTGNAAGGNITFGVARPGASGTAQNAAAEAMRIEGTAAQAFVTIGGFANPFGTFNNQAYLAVIGTPANYHIAAFAIGASSGAAGMDFAKTRGATPSTQVAVQKGDLLFEYDISGSDGTSYQQAASIICAVDQVPITGAVPANMQFQTTSIVAGGGGASARFILDSQGHLVFQSVGPPALGGGTGGDIGASFTPKTNNATVTITIASPAVITFTAHGFVPNQQVSFTTTGALPTGITSGTAYWVMAAGLTVNAFQISAAPGGTAVNTSGSQSGTHTCTASNATSYASSVMSFGESGLTGSDATFGVQIQQTWNTTGVVDAALKLNVTNIASGAGSLLADFQVGGATVFKVDGGGNIVAPSLTGLGGSTLTLFGVPINVGVPGSILNVNFTGNVRNFATLSSNLFDGTESLFGMFLDAVTQVAWAPSSIGTTFDVAISRRAAGVLGLYQPSSHSSATGFQIYNTVDTVSGTPTNYERGVFDWTTTANTLTIGTQAGGTGSARSLTIVSTGMSLVSNTNAGMTFTVGSSGTFTWILNGVATVMALDAFTTALSLGSSIPFAWGSSANAAGAVDTGWYRSSAGVIGIGNGGGGDIASPVANLGLRVQSALAGNANVAGSTFTETASLSTGGGTPGTWIHATGFTGTGAAGTATISNASPAVITEAAHNYFVGEPFTLTTTGTLPTGFSTLTTYYIISAGFGAGAFEASTSFGGAAVNTSSAGSGTHTVNPGGVCTISNASPAVITLNNHGLVPGMQVQFSANGGTLPTGLSAATNYFVISAGLTVNAFEVSATLNGAAINTSSAGSGTFTVLYQGGTLQNPAYTVATWGPSQLTGTITTPALSIAQLFNNGSSTGTTSFVVGNQQLLFGNGPLASSLKIYNTVDNISSPVNFERAVIDWTTNANVLTISTQLGGTGVGRDIRIQTGGAANNIGLGTGNLPNNVAFYAGGPTVNAWSIGQQVVLAFTSTNNAIANGDAGLTRVAPKVLGFHDGISIQGSVGGWYQWAGQTRVTADVTFTSTTTLGTVTGLSVNVIAGRTYCFVAELSWTDAAAGGLQLAISGTCTATNIIYDGYIIDSAANGIKGNAQATALGGVVANATTTGTAGHARIAGTITVNAAGTLLVQAAQSVSNATATTFKRGSYFYVYDS